MTFCADISIEEVRISFHDRRCFLHHSSCEIVLKSTFPNTSVLIVMTGMSPTMSAVVLTLWTWTPTQLPRVRNRKCDALVPCNAELLSFKGIMMLRTYALYNERRRILVFLAFLWALMLVCMLLAAYNSSRRCRSVIFSLNYNDRIIRSHNHTTFSYEWANRCSYFSDKADCLLLMSSYKSLPYSKEYQRFRDITLRRNTRSWYISLHHDTQESWQLWKKQKRTSLIWVCYHTFCGGGHVIALTKFWSVPLLRL